MRRNSGQRRGKKRKKEEKRGKKRKKEEKRGKKRKKEEKRGKERKKRGKKEEKKRKKRGKILDLTRVSTPNTTGVWGECFFPVECFQNEVLCSFFSLLPPKNIQNFAFRTTEQSNDDFIQLKFKVQMNLLKDKKQTNKSWRQKQNTNPRRKRTTTTTQLKRKRAGNVFCFC